MTFYKTILGDPGADSGGEGKSKRTGKRAEKHKSFLAPIRSQNGGERLELVL